MAAMRSSSDFAKPGAFGGFEAEGFQEIEQLDLRLRRSGTASGSRAFELAPDAVEDGVERALGDDFGIEQLERAGGGVARVGECFLAGGFAFGVEFFEAALA